MPMIRRLLIVIVYVIDSCSGQHEKFYLDTWDTEENWTSHFEPCRSHFMFEFSPCEPTTKMLACCRRFNPIVLFVLLVLSLSVIVAVLILMLCCICPPWRVLCECCLCCECCAIDENGTFLMFKDNNEFGEEINIKTEGLTTVTVDG